MTEGTKPYQWQLSEDARGQDRQNNERADARERWEHDHYGWALFAIALLVMVGAFQIVNGLVALFRSGTYQVGTSGLVVDVDYSTWAWVHIVLGALALLAALGLTRGQLWARILGVGLAMLSAIVHMGFIAAFPALALVVITLDVLVAYAIIVHGGDLKHVDY